MSILEGAIGAGVVLAALTHEMSLARKAEKLEEEIAIGEMLAREKERNARRQALGDMREITDARMRSQMMQSGVTPLSSGRAARAVYLQEMSRRNRRY